MHYRHLKNKITIHSITRRYCYSKRLKILFLIFRIIKLSTGENLLSIALTSEKNSDPFDGKGCVSQLTGQESEHAESI